MNDFDLLGLMCSRLCHDLVGPVGAILNGMELVAESGADRELRDQSLELVSESAAELAVRLKFFRLAFGAAGGRLSLSAGEFVDSVAPYLASRRTAFELSAAVDEIAREHLRLLMVLALVGAECLPQGGEVGLDYDPHGAVLARARAHGRRCRLSPELRAVAAGEPETSEARAAASLFLKRAAQAAGVGLALAAEGEEAVIDLAKP